MSSDFDEKAKTWDDDPAKVHRARVVAEAMRTAVPLDSSTRLLEYGAGTGLVSQFLAGHVGPITLAEPSAGMRSVMADKITAGRCLPTPGSGTSTWPSTRFLTSASTSSSPLWPCTTSRIWCRC